MLDPTTFLIVAAIFLISGTVKGAFGIGLPTMAISLMTLTLDPRLAIALLLVPMITSNAWQVYRMAQVRRAFWQYLPFLLSLGLVVWITVMLTRSAPDKLLLGVIGATVVLFVLVSITKWSPHIPDPWDRPAQLIFGTIAGIMGGLTAVWAAPAVIYLSARKTLKDEFVRATGIIIFAGSVPLALGYLQQGFLTASLALTSTALLIPTLAGFALGEKLRGKLPEKQFRNALLAIFFIMGLNLLRRAIF